MNDQGYIKEGVELADGFNFDRSTGYRWVDREGEPSFYFGGQWSLIPEFHKQIFLNALAAQLVRQHLKYHTASVYTAWHRDPLKTIKCLVDDKV